MIGLLKYMVFYLTEEVIVYSMVILFLIYLYLFFRGIDKFKKNIPNAIASLGIIGTFAGIYMGLMNFDIRPGNMEKSIPELLSGMKLAFFTSIMGLIISTFCKFLEGFNGKNRKKEEVEILNIFKELLKTTKENDSSILKDSIENLRDSVLNTNDETVDALRNVAITNSKIGEELSSGNEKLINEFINFRNEMGKSFTQEFTRALSESIEDLNIQLQKYLGENFKNSVDKLISWQEHYMETISEAVETLEKTKISMVTMENSMGIIAEKSEILVQAGKIIKPLMEGTEILQNRMIEGNEQIEENMEKFQDIIENLETHGKYSINNLNIIVEETSKNLYEMKNNFIGLSESFESSFENILKEIQTGMKNVVDHSKLIGETSLAQIENMEDISNRLGNTSEQIVQELAEKLKESFMMADQAINESIKKVEEGLNTNLDNCLSGLVSALSNVSDKFVKDYTPLTEKLRKVVELSKAV